MISPSPSASPLFEARSLTREYDEGQVKALRGVDFSINGGEFVAIVGPSGCGKSTLLQLLGALDRPTSGTLLYRGNSLADASESRCLSCARGRIYFSGLSFAADFHRGRERADPDV